MPQLFLLLLICPAAALAGELDDFEAALKAARAGHPWEAQAQRFQGGPLYIYLQQAQFNRDPSKFSLSQLQALIDPQPDGMVESDMRKRALNGFAKSGRHADLLAIHRPGIGLAEDCLAFAARLALQQEVTLEQARLLYGRADTLTPECKGAFDWLQAQGELTTAMLQLRFEQALTDRRFDLARALKGQVATSLGHYAERSYALHAGPAAALDAAAKWPVEINLQPHLAAAVARLARTDPRAAERHREALSRRFSFQPEQIGQMQRAIAVYAAVDRMDNALPWFARMDPAQMDDEAWAWRLRFLLHRREFGPALSALDDLPENLRRNSQWAYAGGRLAEINGYPEQAKQWFALAAVEATFHGFLAADRIDAPYALCDTTPTIDAQLRSSTTADITVTRALAWWKLGDRTRAFREWWYGLQHWAQPLRHAAGLLAAENDWHDAAVWALNGDQARSFYRARFPMAYQEATRKQARKNGLSPSWVRGLARAESVWNPQARSSANAVGLMQLLPSTASGVAKRHGLRTNAQLTEPDDNIALGSAYLSELAQRYSGQPILATAAYNAGPGAVNRWPVAADMPIDLWIETITYKETREYVPRVLAFSVIYDWRADNKITRLSDRLPGLGQTPMRQVQAQCPGPALAP